jgi:hypothetical protein
MTDFDAPQGRDRLDDMREARATTLFDPPSARALPATRLAAMRRELAAVVAAPPSRRRRPLLIAASAVVVAAGTSAGAYAYVARSQPVTDKNEARCYTVASLSDGPQSYTSLAQATPVNSGKPGQVTDALGDCASLWQQGFLHAGLRGAAMPIAAPSPGAENPVPPLVACVMPDGTAAVFPGTRATCATLGLPNAR